MQEIVGRDGDLAAIERWLDGPQPTVLLIEGEAGIGKTTLWRWAAERAADRGWRVLTAGPAAAETRLAFAAVGDLLDEVVEVAVARLPLPQRRALEVALLL
jgi:AAA ATPase domain